MFRKAQSAMEYLMTYGWAILIILIAVGALFYLGVFSPKTSSICQLSAPFVCDDVVINNNGVLFLIKGGNMVGNANVGDIKINGESCSELNGFLYNTNIMEYAYTGCAVGLSEDNKISGDISIDYTLQGGLSHDLDGEYSGSVEEGSIFNNIQQAGGIFHLDNQNLIFGWDGESSINYVNGVEVIPGGGLIVPNTDGYLGMGSEFDGTLNSGNDKIDTGSDFIGANAITVSAWIYMEGGGEGNAGRIIDNGKFIVKTTSAYNLYVCSVGDTGCVWYSYSSTKLNDWHHITITRTTGGIVNLYIDGILSNPPNQNPGIPTGEGTTNVIIGNNNGQTLTFDGIIDEVHVWNRILSPEEIQNLYNSYI